MNLTDWYRVQIMELLPARAARREKARGLQDAQVLHDAEPRYLRQLCFQLGERLAITLVEPVEQPPPMRIAQRPKDRFHTLDIM